MRNGIYIRQIKESIHGTPEKLAQEAESLNLAFVPILVIWQDLGVTKTINSKLLSEYATALAEVGVEPWIWGYPWVGREEQFIERIQWAIEQGPCRGVLIDPELGYQFKVASEDEVRKGARRLCEGVIDCLNESMNVGVTSYGAAHVQRRFPWDHFCMGFGSPQFYTATEEQIKRGVASWREHGWITLIPSVPLYGPNSGRKLGPYLDVIKSVTDIEGFLFWSWRQVGAGEKDLIRGLGA